MSSVRRLAEEHPATPNTLAARSPLTGTPQTSSSRHDDPLARDPSMDRRPSHGALRAAAIITPTKSTPRSSKATIRSVTPEPLTDESGGNDGIQWYNGHTTSPSRTAASRSQGSMSPQSPASPRSSYATANSYSSHGGGERHAGSSRRQAGLWGDQVPEHIDTLSPSPPPRPTSARPRGHTLDAPYARQVSLTPLETLKPRLGSVSGATGIAGLEESIKAQSLPKQSTPLYPEFASLRNARPTELRLQSSTSDQRTPTRSKHLKQPSRSASPLYTSSLAVDSLVVPVEARDPNRTLSLMNRSGGRMRGAVACQTPHMKWSEGVCYVDEDRGSLLFDPKDGGAVHVPIISDLRGCQAYPKSRPGYERAFLEIIAEGTEVCLLPRAPEELEAWLAVLLFWQQIGPRSAHLSENSIASTPTDPHHPNSALQSRTGTPGPTKNVIKFGTVRMLDTGRPSTPHALVARTSLREAAIDRTSWRSVVFLLRDDGDLSIIVENSETVIGTITLSKLMRHAIQVLDKSVLGEDHCIVILPIYAPHAAHISIVHPYYINLESRVGFEVWYWLLRAHAVPDTYSLGHPESSQIHQVDDLSASSAADTFRTETSIYLRVIEAKLGSKSGQNGQHSRENQHHEGDDYHVGDYVAEIVLNDEIRARTSTETRTRNPFWRDEFVFRDLAPALPHVSVHLKRIEAFDHYDNHGNHPNAHHGMIVESEYGSVKFGLRQGERGKDHEEWLAVTNEYHDKLGSILVKAKHEELVVFRASQYAPLSDLLHNFDDGLTLQIAAAFPGQLKKPGELLLNIFYGSGKTDEWLEMLIEDEVDSHGSLTSKKKSRFSNRVTSNDSSDNTMREAFIRDMNKSATGEANLLFRGNTLLTQSLEVHMRRYGGDYLETILGDKLREINNLDPDCEVDPSKMQPDQDIEQHWALLLRFTQEIWDRIVTSAHKLPSALRRILKRVRAAAEDRYGDFARTVVFTSVTGFLFLRFICPAVLNPKLFGLLRDFPRPRAQRTLTLITKVLQALANLSNIGKKEVFMEPINHFLATQRQPLKDFIDAVCAIPADQADDALHVSYSAPNTIWTHKSSAEREALPKLPYLVDQNRSFAALIKLWVDANPMSKRGMQDGQGDMLVFNDMCMTMQKRADLCLAKLDELRAARAAKARDDAAKLAQALQHVDLDANAGLMTGDSSLDGWPAPRRPPGSSGSEAASAGSQSASEAKRAIKSTTSAVSNLHSRWGGSKVATRLQLFEEPDKSRRSRTDTSRSASSHSHAHSSSVSGAARPQVSSHHHSSGTIKALPNGKGAKKFLTGFLRGPTGGADKSGAKGRAETASPDSSSSATATFASSSDSQRGRPAVPTSAPQGAWFGNGYQAAGPQGREPPSPWFYSTPRRSSSRERNGSEVSGLTSNNSNTIGTPEMKQRDHKNSRR